MSINLAKGQKIDLSKDGNSLNYVRVGLGWDPVDRESRKGFFKSLLKDNRPKQDIDIDASVLLCDKNGRLVSEDPQKSVIYFGNLSGPRSLKESIVHQGDNLTGDGEGDDEEIKVKLNDIPKDIEKLIFIVNIYRANEKGQHFGNVENAYIRLVDESNKSEICKFNLSENYDGMEGMIVAEIYRKDSSWKFNAIGQPIKKASFILDIMKRFL